MASPPKALHATIAVEGLVDAAVLRRICDDLGIAVSSVYGKKGKNHIQKSIAGYNQAAKRSCWIVLVDLDGDSCPGALRQSWLPTPASGMCFRVAVREVEAWLMADTERISRFLSVSKGIVPRGVDNLKSPKDELVNIARRSRRSKIRSEMVPRIGSGRRVGTAYSSRLIEYASSPSSGWRPEAARSNSSSLDRCLTDLEARLHLYLSGGLDSCS